MCARMPPATIKGSNPRAARYPQRGRRAAADTFSKDAGGDDVSEADEVPELIRQLRNGDPKGAEELFALYAQRLTRVAEKHLSHKVAGRIDGEDVVQSVFRTFFRRSARGEFQIDSSAQLWMLLVKITLLKARAKGRFHTAAIRAVTVEAAGNSEAELAVIAAREPGPLEAAILVDQIETLLQGLPSLHCRVLDLRLQGCGPSEVARRLDVSRQTVFRVLDLLQQRLEVVARDLK
jgi:RNA polymerase sigma-70 factor, ECF subfamily